MAAAKAALPGIEVIVSDASYVAATKALVDMVKAKYGRIDVLFDPRPPRLEPTTKRLRIIFAGRTIADTVAGYRVLETSHPPVYYIPPAGIPENFLENAPGTSWCEFKGEA